MTEQESENTTYNWKVDYSCTEYLTSNGTPIVGGSEISWGRSEAEALINFDNRMDAEPKIKDYTVTKIQQKEPTLPLIEMALAVVEAQWSAVEGQDFDRACPWCSEWTGMNKHPGHCVVEKAKKILIGHGYPVPAAM